MAIFLIERDQKSWSSASKTVLTLTWRSLEAAEYATLEWVDWFNHHRLLEPIGHVPPAEFEQEYYQQNAGLAIAA
jgi:transposase InsO family protein